MNHSTSRGAGLRVAAAIVGIVLALPAPVAAEDGNGRSVAVLGKLVRQDGRWILQDTEGRLLHHVVADDEQLDLSPFRNREVVLTGFAEGEAAAQSSLRATTVASLQEEAVEPIEIELDGPQMDFGLVDDPATLPGNNLCNFTAGCGLPGRFWVRAEYLMWWADGMYVPPLVTNSAAGTPAANAGVLGLPTTTLLFGNTDILDDVRHGGRLRTGIWLGGNQRLGVSAEYFGLATKSMFFGAASDATGAPILARPFFNVNPRTAAGAFAPPAREDAELVAYPNILAGRVTVEADSQLHSISSHVRWQTCCTEALSGLLWAGGASRVDFLAGYRFLRLDEGLLIREQLTSLDRAAPGEFLILDQFATRNDFHGVDLGVEWQLTRQRLFLEFLGRIAVGNVRQTVEINGRTQTTPPAGPVANATGGLLAQRTNIGRYTRNQLAVVPELGAIVGFRLTPRLSLTAGYTLVFWSRVARPGDQISLDVNPDLLPPERVPFEGALRPALAFRDSDFWAQGLNFGVDFRW